MKPRTEYRLEDLNQLVESIQNLANYARLVPQGFGKEADPPFQNIVLLDYSLFPRWHEGITIKSDPSEVNPTLMQWSTSMFHGLQKSLSHQGVYMTKECYQQLITDFGGSGAGLKRLASRMGSRSREGKDGVNLPAELKSLISSLDLFKSGLGDFQISTEGDDMEIYKSLKETAARVYAYMYASNPSAKGNGGNPGTSETTASVIAAGLTQIIKGNRVFIVHNSLGYNGEPAIVSCAESAIACLTAKGIVSETRLLIDYLENRLPSFFCLAYKTGLRPLEGTRDSVKLYNYSGRLKEQPLPASALDSSNVPWLNQEGGIRYFSEIRSLIEMWIQIHQDSGPSKKGDASDQPQKAFGEVRNVSIPGSGSDSALPPAGGGVAFPGEKTPAISGAGSEGLEPGALTSPASPPLIRAGSPGIEGCGGLQISPIDLDATDVPHPSGARPQRASSPSSLKEFSLDALGSSIDVDPDPNAEKNQIHKSGQENLQIAVADLDILVRTIGKQVRETNDVAGLEKLRGDVILYSSIAKALNAPSVVQLISDFSAEAGRRIHESNAQGALARLGDYFTSRVVGGGFNLSDPIVYDPLRSLVQETIDALIKIEPERKEIEILSQPAGFDPRTYVNKTILFTEFADESGVLRSTVLQRLRNIGISGPGKGKRWYLQFTPEQAEMLYQRYSWIRKTKPSSSVPEQEKAGRVHKGRDQKALFFGGSISIKALSTLAGENYFTLVRRVNKFQNSGDLSTSKEGGRRYITNITEELLRKLGIDPSKAGFES